ncbi:MAG: ATP-dependent zinc metalloprotease FtsH, partial [Acidiferrobacterales bacterium]
SPETDNRALVGDLLRNNVTIDAKPPEEQSLLLQIFINWFPMLLLVGVWVFFMRQMQGGGSGRGAMGFGKSRARMLTEEQNKITFEDVAGVEEAKEEVGELVEFLRDPSKFQKLGGRIPKGVLMTGSPGTGKTLLAKAIAGEAKVPFFSISGSDFVEMFVGVGASRVRDMFEQAKKHAPCIIFIDEIDAVGRQRGAGLGGGHDEREQTLNQLLVEMDGFEGTEGVIVIAATNRPDVLDPALLRPGRFDRQVYVPLPDIRGREQILTVHMRKVPVSDNVVPSIIARGTPGFSGADLANLVNEAALFAARANKRLVDMEDFEKAKDKIVMGAERRSIVMPEKERMNTAYHESGHAVVAKMLPNTDPVHKVTIIPRGRALGVTMQLPIEDRYSHDRESLLSTIAVLMGGRIAEEVFMHQMTTGAANDFERATELARNMVTRWGMSDALGTRVYGENQSEVFLGRDVTTHKNLSDATAQLVDNEIRRIIDEQYARARKIIEDNRDKIELMAKALLEWETLNADQLDDIMAGKQPRPPEDFAGPAAPGSDQQPGSPAALKPRAKPIDAPAAEH